MGCFKRCCEAGINEIYISLYRCQTHNATLRIDMTERQMQRDSGKENVKVKQDGGREKPGKAGTTFRELLSF